MGKKETPSFYAIIPASVRYDKDLCPNAKLLYGEITALCEKEGYCWASNKYLSNLYGVNRSSITNWINQLIKSGHITQGFIYDDAKTLIVERRIFLTNKMPYVPQEPVQSEKNNETAAPAGGFGGRDAALKLDFEDKNKEGGGQIFDQGGQILQEVLIQAINTNSAADQKTEKSDSDANSEAAEAATAQLKQFFKNLNAALIFDKTFYPKALAFFAENGLDSGYANWVYKYCLDRKPAKIAGFYFKVFFEPRFVDLYRESSRPPPVTAFLCPVCGTEHDAALKTCPKCGLKAEDRNDRRCLDREKKLYAMPPDKRAAYEDELNNLFPAVGLPINFEEKIRLVKILEEKYGLNDPPE
jgi:rubrerythrin